MQRLVTLCVFCLAAPFARAQSFNIDVGTDNPTPSAALGAAAMQPGTWNTAPVNNLAMNLVDLSGASTGVVLQRTQGAGSEYSWDNLMTFGDDELLMDDGEFPQPDSTWTISGLAAGTYEVTTYAWAPDSAMLISGVSVNGGPVTPVGGTWSGTYQLGVTHALDTVVIGANGSIAIHITTVFQYATFDGIQIKQIGGGVSFVTFCSGDGSGTACPCGNAGIAGNGCASSIFASGAHLAGSGNPSISNDTFVITGSSMPNSSALYFQGTARTNGGAGSTFGDGLRCASGSVVRLGTKVNAGGTSSYPTGGNVHIGVKGANSAGDVRDYQVWYRNAASYCTPSTFNLSNGLEITWTP